MKNTSAAKKLAINFINGANSILEFPYSLSIYSQIKKLENEYRSLKIKGFLMFYTINEKEKIITIVRFLYQKMDIDNIL